MLKLWDKIKRFFVGDKPDDKSDDEAVAAFYETVAELVDFETSPEGTTVTFRFETKVCAASSEDCCDADTDNSYELSMDAYEHRIGTDKRDSDEHRLPEFYYAHRPLVWLVFPDNSWNFFYFDFVIYIIYHAWLAKQNKFLIRTLNHEQRFFSGVPP